MSATTDRIRAWARDLGLPAAPVEHLGSGESYDAWRIGDVVVGLARRPLDELPRPLEAEVEALALVPDDLGPRSVLVEESPDVLGAPFVVTTYVPGREVPAAQWSDELLTAHARQLARLHAQPHEREPLSLAGRLDAALGWWRDRHPEALDPVADLVPRLVAYVADAEPLFARLARFALVHGDLVVTNIVVNAGVPRYIDWEWGEIGDPAQDLALLGGAISVDPWYLPLSPHRLELLLDAYGADDELGARRDAYEVFERFFTALHFRQTRRHLAALEVLTAGLRDRLG